MGETGKLEILTESFRGDFQICKTSCSNLTEREGEIIELLLYGWDWLPMGDCSLIGLMGLIILIGALIFKVEFKIPKPSEKSKKGSKNK